MKFILLITFMLTVAIYSPIPALDRWQARFRFEMLASVQQYLPTNPGSAEARTLLRELYALPDSAYAQTPGLQ